MTAHDDLGVCRVVRAPDWADLTTEEQEEAWDFLRGVFARRAIAAGYTIDRAPAETVEHHELTDSLLLRIDAVGEREDQPA